MIIGKLPWQQPPLDKWDIVSIQHGTPQETKFIYVAMYNTDNDELIRASGPDDNAIWVDLYNQAKEFEK